MKPKYLFLAIFILLGLIWAIISQLPDGKLHIFFCDVGQGDAIYIRMPNNADLLVDGGTPDNKVLNCLGRNMPFYDRTLDLVLMTHPQQDHFGGLISVIKRYTIKNFVTAPVYNPISAFDELIAGTNNKNIPVRSVFTGDSIHFGQVTANVLWPQKDWFEQMRAMAQVVPKQKSYLGSNLYEFNKNVDLNIFSIYLHLRYGDFDLLLTGDGDIPLQTQLIRFGIELPQSIEVLKVPHHGSALALLTSTIDQLEPQLSVIEVGKNGYGHPNPTIVESLKKYGQVLRTDQNKTIELVSDGHTWEIKH